MLRFLGLQVDGVLHIHLPQGPTAHYKISSLIPGKDIKVRDAANVIPTSRRIEYTLILLALQSPSVIPSYVSFTWLQLFFGITLQMLTFSCQSDDFSGFKMGSADT